MQGSRAGDGFTLIELLIVIIIIAILHGDRRPDVPGAAREGEGRVGQGGRAHACSWASRGHATDHEDTWPDDTRREVSRARSTPSCYRGPTTRSTTRRRR